MKITKILKNSKKILEGLKNTIIKTYRVEKIARKRLAICNDCIYGMYDGQCEVPGTGPCCGACGCSLKLKVRSLSSECGAVEIGKEPLWKAVISEEEDV